MEIIQESLFGGKVCSKCQVWKPYLDFRKRLTVPDGYRNICKLCQNKDDAIRQSRYSGVVAEKRCPGCSLVQGAEHFDRNKHNKDGLASFCKACKKKRRPAPVKSQAIGKKCPVCKIKKPSKEFGHCCSNPGGLQTKCKKCKQSHYASAPVPTEKRCPVCKCVKPASEFYKNRALATGLSAQCKKCRIKSTGKRATKNATYNRYRARKKSAGGSFTTKQWEAICQHYGNKCLRCGSAERITIDHVISILHGGSNNVDNLQPLCKSCNSAKSSNDIDYRPDGGAFGRSLL